jgi:hypothetical protein
MKIQHAFSRWTIPAVAVILSGIALVSWTGSPKHTQQAQHQKQDTVPSKKSRNNRDLDRELRQLEEAQKNLQRFSERDFEKMQEDIQKSIEKINVEAIELQAEQALKQVDLEKMQKEIQESLSKIDFDKIERDIQEAMEQSEEDMKDLREELQKARTEVQQHFNSEFFRKEMEELKKVNMDDVKKEMQEVKKELEKVKVELDKEKLDIKKELDKAQIELGKAQTELKGYQEMIYSMEADGLLDTKNDYTIEFNNNELTIDGKKQSSAVTEKYKKYFKKGKVTIKKSDDDIELNNEDDRD